MKILIINGPNLNLLGTREPDIYGKVSMEEFLKYLENKFPNEEILYYQSNVEGELINRIQEGGFDALVTNFGAFSHYAYAIADCLKTVQTPIVEVHISNLYKREDFRRHSVTAPNSDAFLSGFGLNGYELAITYLLDRDQY